MPAAIPAIIGAAGTIGGALLGNKKSSSENTALSGLSSLVNTEVVGQQQGLKSATPLLGQSSSDLKKVSDFLTPLLTGGRQAALESAAPEVNTILSQYDTAKKSISEFSPRGGGTNSQLADLPFKESGDITNLLSREKSAAASNLASVGGTEGSLASSLLPRDTGAGSSLLNYALGNKAQQGQMFGSLGTSIGTLLGKIPGFGGSGSATESDFNLASTAG